jgi:hypothetical protein
VSVTEQHAVAAGDRVCIGDAERVAHRDGDAVPHAEVERESDDDAEPLLERVPQADAERVSEAELHVDAERDCASDVDREFVTVVDCVAAGEHPAAVGAESPAVGHAREQAHVIGADEPAGQYDPAGHRFCIANADPAGQ